MIPANTEDKANVLEETLGNDLDYSVADTSFSPWYSDIGLGIDGSGGISALFFHYNRNTTRFGSPFLAVTEKPVAVEKSVTAIVERFTQGTLRIAFASHNTWVVETEGLPELSWSFIGHAGLTEARRESLDAAAFIYRGFLPGIDKRTPDSNFPFAIGIRIIEGKIAGGDGITAPIQITGIAGRIRLLFTARTENVAVDGITASLADTGLTVDAARDATRRWISQALGNRTVPAGTSPLHKTIARAIHTLISNACMAPGFLSGRIASFPSRGKYPTHFLWDTCFENLALESFEPRIAEDGLLLLTESLRPDGKMAHFLCSTWVRPHDSQPPLVGWAGLRLVKARNDISLAAKLLPALQRNNAWWLAHRGTRFSLISTLSGLETGWDDSPRFDNGPTIACDMNAYLLMQMRACAELARLLGDERSAREQDAEADAYARRIVEVLFDSESGLFFDRHAANGDFVHIKTPACFMPLLAGVPLPEKDARDMIQKYLLSPDHFYGPVPFPSVAYDEPVYDPAQWWRGPTWPPVAYFMIEVLERSGFHAEARASRQRLHDLILSAGDLRELFNSQSGEGLGAREQGWTAAIFLRLTEELANA